MRTRTRIESWRLVLRIVLAACVLGTVIFIFSNSSAVGEVSGAVSGAVVTWLNDRLARMGFALRISEVFLRKTAHFAEYALLGFWLMLCLRAYTRRIKLFVSWPLLFGLCTAVADECYQLFVPGREGKVADVAIDFGGVVCGLLVGLLAFHVAVAIRDRRRGRK